jgi:hypothetical protein
VPSVFVSLQGSNMTTDFDFMSVGNIGTTIAGAVFFVLFFVQPTHNQLIVNLRKKRQSNA